MPIPSTFGPNLDNELRAAGYSGVHFSWSSDGSYNLGSGLTDDQRAGILSVLNAHDPAKPDPNIESDKLFKNGITITSTSAPAIAGTYGIMPQDEINISGLQIAVQQNVFPGWYTDIVRAKHTMTPTQFTAIAEQILTSILAINNAKDAALQPGGTWTPPATTIAMNNL